MDVLFVASELTPIAKVGGLGDVVGALPKSLARLCAKPTILIPYYRNLDRLTPKRLESFETLLHGVPTTVEVFETRLPETDIPVLLAKHDLLYRDDIYDTSKDSDDPERFAFLSAVAISTLKNHRFDLVHCHDWMTGLIPLAVHQARKNSENWSAVKTLLTIHNVHPYEEIGLLKKGFVKGLGIPADLLPSTDDADSYSVNLLAMGIVSADAINTVSKTHAKEILAQKFGGPVAPLLRKRKSVLSGILNGIDVDLFNPATDRHITPHYSAKNLENKTENKKTLEKELGWPSSGSIPLFGMVTRLYPQKGLDFLVSLAEPLSKLPLRIVILGEGERGLEQELSALEKKQPNTFRAIIKFDQALAQRIYAGADGFLMPSRFEPCGLGQMIAMRYGTLPVVHKTGGLADTVRDNRTGFVFSSLAPGVFLETIQRAMTTFSQPAKWRTMQLAAMKQDFSWDSSAREYQALYDKLAKE